MVSSSVLDSLALNEASDQLRESVTWEVTSLASSKLFNNWQPQGTS